jgi:hypothetical protein
MNMTPGDDITLRDIYGLIYEVRTEMNGLRTEFKTDIGEVKKSLEDFKALMASKELLYEKRFGDLEGCIDVVNTRIYYLAAGLTLLATVLGALVYFHWT